MRSHAKRTVVLPGCLPWAGGPRVVQQVGLAYGTPVPGRRHASSRVPRKGRCGMGALLSGELDEPPRRLDGRADQAGVVTTAGGLGGARRERAAWDAQMVEGRMIESPVTASTALFKG